MSVIKALACITIALSFAPVIEAETRCPGNVASLRFPANPSSQIIVPVMINHSGPYQFLVDTGTRITIVDPSLATELQLKFTSETEMDGIGFTGKTSIVRIESLQTGSRSVENTIAETQDLRTLQAAGLHIQGMLGGAFLEHFDLLIDYAHNLFCLDDTKAMRKFMSGALVKTEAVTSKADELPTSGLVIVPVRLSGSGNISIHLALDSGTNQPFLYNPGRYLPNAQYVTQPGRSTDGIRREYLILPPQTMQIGSLNLKEVTFAAPPHTEPVTPKIPLDGLLAASFFRRVFISYSDKFVMLESR